jgi:two-component system response regulator
LQDKTILLVEDNADDVDLTVRAFKKNKISNSVIVARDGQEAIDQLYGDKSGEPLLQNLPEVVLLDLNLPRVSGIEVLKRIRKESRTRYLPVVILTTSSEEKDIAESYKLGANSYIRKPVDFHEFMEAVRELGLYWLVLNRNYRKEGE